MAVTAAVLAPRPAVATAVCTNAACTGSYTHRDLCECTMCDGAGHGAQYRTEYSHGIARMQAKTARTGNPFHGIPMDDDEPW